MKLDIRHGRLDRFTNIRIARALPLALALLLAVDLSAGTVRRKESQDGSRGLSESETERGMSVESLRRLGEIQIQEKALGAALYTFKQIVSRSPKDIGALIRLADIYSWTGDYDHSIALYRDAVTRDTVNLAATKGLARVLRWAGRYAEAGRMYEQVLRLEPEDIDGLSGLAVLCAQQRNLEEALRRIELAVRLSPRDPGLLTIKGDILAWSSRYSEAEQVYLTARDLNPNSAEVRRSLANLYKWNNRPGKAYLAFQEAHRLDPRNIDYLADMAEMALSMGSVREAEDAVHEMFSLAPDEPRAYNLLRDIEARSRLDYARILQEYVKPATLLMSILAISIYFHRRREILERRHRLYWRVTYQLLPAIAGCFILTFLVLRQGGFPNAGLIEGVAELLTFVFLIAAFSSLIRVSRVRESDTRKSVLAVGAHPDDLELGCGATLAKFKEMGYNVYGMVITGGEQGNPFTNDRVDRKEEARRGASVLGLDHLQVCGFQDTRLSSQMVEVKNAIEARIKETNADIIITQSPHDLHQDHRAVFEATKIAARGDKTVLCYEDVSTEAHFMANYFVDVTEFIEDKIVAIQTHRTQRHKKYMDPDNIRGRAAHRGLQSGVRYAEAFLLYKGVDSWSL